MFFGMTLIAFICLIISAGMVSLGLTALFGGLNRMANHEKSPYTAESFLSITRLLGASSLVEGAGFAAVALMNHVVFHLGFLYVTDGLLVLLGCLVVGHFIGRIARNRLVKKAEQMAAATTAATDEKVVDVDAQVY